MIKFFDNISLVSENISGISHFGKTFDKIIYYFREIKIFYNK